MSEKGTEVERLRVVIEADSNPYKKEMKGLAEETKKDTKELDKQNDLLKKSMNGQFGAVKKVREQMDKFYNATMKAFKLQDSGLKNVNPYENPLKKIKGFEKAFENPLKKVFGEEGMQKFRNPYAHIFNSQKEFQKEMDSVENRMKKLIATRDELEASGGDIEMTAEFKDLTKAAEQAEKKLNRLIEKKERLAATGGLTTKNQRTLNYDIAQAENELKYAKAAMADMSTSDKYQNTEKWNKLNREIGKCRVSLAQYHEQEQRVGKGNVTSRISKTFSSLYARLQKVTPAIKKVSGAFAALIQRFRNGIPVINRAKNSMSGFGGLGGMFKTLGMTARFMFASFLIQGVLGQAKAGMQNLAKYSNIYGTQFNSSVSMMYSALKQLQNALATAFAPIVNVVAPYITTLINYLTAGANALAQFFSALTGSKTWTRATYNTQNYADSLESAAGSAKKLKNELYGFDEITKQSDDESGSGGSGSGGGGVSPGNMFTEETVNNQFADFANMVKDAWKNADFTEIGEIVGNKLNDALNNINWNKIQETSKKIAKSIATFINGFIETEGLAKSVGNTIGNAINTGVGIAHTFFSTTNFFGFGSFVAETINNAIETTDFGMIGQTIAEKINAKINAVGGFAKTFNFKKFGESIGESISSFFRNFEFAELADALNAWADGIVDAIAGVLDGITWNDVFKGVGTFLGKLKLKTVNVLIGAFLLKYGGKALSSGILKSIISGKLADLAGTTGIGNTAAVGFTIGATVYVGFKFAEDAKKWWENIQEYGWNEGRRKTAEENPANPYRNGRAVVQEDVDVEISAEERKKGVRSILKMKKVIEKQWGKLNLPVGNKFETLSNDVSNWASKVKDWWGERKLSISNKFETIASTVERWFKKTKSWWGERKLSISNKFETLSSHVTGWFDKVKNWWGNKTLPVNNNLETNNGTVAGWANSIVAWWNGNKSSLGTDATVNNAGSLFSTVENVWNNSRRNLNVTVNAALGAVTGGLSALLNLRAEGGVFANGRWHPVTAYANGGMPNTGQLFVAREAGPELVGTIGGNTAVMNNKQIVSSVAAGVSSAVYSAVLAAMAKSGGSSPSFNIYVGGKKITDVVIEEVNQRTKATGVSPLLV